MGKIKTIAEIEPKGDFPVVSAPYVQVGTGSSAKRLDTVLTESATVLNSKADKSYVDAEVDKKVDKVSGKGLSTNDYTTAEKDKLSTIASGATKVVVDTDLNASSNNAVSNKVVTNAFASKVDNTTFNSFKTSNTAAINAKSDKTYVDTELAKKANTTDLTSGLATKSDNSTVSALSSRVSTNETNISTQTARIDSIAALPSGSTSGDAELMDIRVGADGKTYASAGAAVRTQFSDVKSDLSEITVNSINLVDTTKIENGYYVNQTSGAYEPNANHCVIKNVAVNDNKSYIFGLYNFDAKSYGNYVINSALRVVFYNSNGTYISGILCNTVGSNIFVTPNGCKSVSISWMKNDSLQPMLETGNSLDEYEEFGYKINMSKVDAYTKEETDSKFIAKSTGLNPYIYKSTPSINNLTFFATGESNLLKEYTIIFKGNVTSFNKILVGIFYPNDTMHNRIEIDNTYVWNKNYSGNVNYYTHGLTINKDICVIIKVHYNLTADITIISNGNEFVQNGIAWSGASQPTQAFAYNNGSVLTGCAIEQIAEFTKNIFAFGDSYFNYNQSRWMYYVDNKGYSKSILINGVGGAISSWSTTSKDTLFSHGTPKFALWCIGMNDGSDENENTPQALWLSNVLSFIKTCEDKGIVPILSTIPNVPNISHKGKNKWVRESGYRYIEFAKAVGSDSNTSWNEGLLSSDNVHPTEEGAKVLFSQAIIDFPEIIAYSGNS